MIQKRLEVYLASNPDTRGVYNLKMHQATLHVYEMVLYNLKQGISYKKLITDLEHLLADAEERVRTAQLDRIRGYFKGIILTINECLVLLRQQV